MKPEPVKLFHDPLAEVQLPSDRVSAPQQPRRPRTPTGGSTRRYANTTASRAASLEAVVRDLRRLERRTASRGMEG